MSLRPFQMTVIALALAMTSAFGAGRAASPIPQQLEIKLALAGVHPGALDVLEQEMRREHYNRRTVAIVDYTLPANQPRFFVIDLRQGTFKAYPVSHGYASGGNLAEQFSNRSGSNQSSLGFLRTGAIYTGKFGRSMRLEGLSRSNSNVAARGIVLHSAEYSSQEFFERNGFWGRSFGCLAVPQDQVDEVLDSLGAGALILAYHDRLWAESLKNPQSQSIPDPPRFPPPTPWELEENNRGDLEPHHLGDPPSSFYKNQFQPGACSAS